ncbi:SH3 domain-containing protein [Streptomyces sp. H27-C3]|uniref:SH3 domain-containing protein n=1 Tax=Streptomyces sp. H27-C3 TaxID=3046305 RepID=UPI0024BAA216|nr:SH3 domain-containing protein [Streptomyces sp. H27-C3]MDJ0466340.1 SH3 domain-containing protein [Streptomyces sp. H27-C3]
MDTAGINADKAAGAETSTEETTSAATALRYPVAPGHRVNVRSGPGTSYGVVKVLPYGARVPINCQCPGTRVSGPYGTTNLWSNIGNGQFVSDSYIKTGSDGYVAPHCS